MDTPAIEDVEAGIIDEKRGEENENINITPLCATPPPVEEVRVEVNNEVKPNSPQNAPQPAAISQVVDASAVQAASPSEEPQNAKWYYPGDVVVVKENKQLNGWQPFFGTVLKPAAGTEILKSPDKGSSTDFQVHWDLTNRITQIKSPDVALVDRSLYRGQKVENVKGEVGTITRYETTVSVQISGTTEVVENVPLNRLRPISPHVRGQEVLLHGWVGVITGIKRNVWFRVDGGPTFYLEAYERDGFARTDPFWGLGVACPGMRIRLASAVLKKAKWASSIARFFSRVLPFHYIYAWPFSTIIRTEVVELEVMWLQPAPGLPNPELLTMPHEIVSRPNLSRLLVVGTPSSETIGIGSVRKINLLPDDNVSEYLHWLEGFKKKFVDELYFTYPRTKAMNITKSPLKELVAYPHEETPVRVLLRHNIVTVKWEDGRLEKMASIDIPKIAPIADDGEFPAGLTVAHVQKDTSNGDRYGIVMDSSELAKARTRKVNIRWIVDGKDDGVVEESVFDIKPHAVYSMYHRGTILFPRNPSSAQFKSAVVIDVNIPDGRMVVVRSSDNLQDEVFPHQVIALAKRCHWSFFSRKWTVDDMVPPPYQLELEYDPAHRMVDVSEQRLDVLDEDPNNPLDDSKDTFPTLWDEPPFELLGFAPESHRYYRSSSTSTFGKNFADMIAQELAFIQQKENVPEGIWIRSYENRMDLLSVLMVGPSKTPYEDGLFMFDVQLPATFPSCRPAAYFVSYSLEIHPCLSNDGNVCTSMIPWEFLDGEERPDSYIVYFLSKLQALLFTPSPYFSTPSKKNEENLESGRVKSELYNQGVFVRVLDSTWNMLQSPHDPWQKSIHNHFVSILPEKLQCIEKWMNGERPEPSVDYEDEYPSYSQSPMPEGLRMALKSRVEAFKKLIKQVPVVDIQSVSDTTADSESHSVEEPANTPVPIVVAAESNRRLTPISELTEPSSTSTFGNKHSNLSVSDHDSDSRKGSNVSGSMDSLKNIKQKTKGVAEKPRTPALEITEAVSDAEVSAKEATDKVSTVN